MNNSLVKKVVIYGIGNLGAKLIVFLLLPIYAHFLTQEELGIYDLFMTTLSLLVPVAGMQLGDSAYRWILDAKKKSEISSAISNTLILFIGFTVFSCCVGLVILLFFPMPYAGLFLGILVFQSIFYYIQQIVRGFDETKLFALLGLLNTFILLLLSVVLLKAGGDQLQNVIYSYLLTYFLVVCFALYRIKIFTFIDITLLDSDVMWKQLNYAFPLVANMMSWWLINFSSKYVILFFMGADSNGVFAVASRMAAILMVINSIYMLAVQDIVIGNKERKNNQVSDAEISAYNGFIRFELYTVALLTIMSPLIIKVLFSEVYFEAWYYMPILLLSVAFSAFSAYVGLGYQLLKKTWNILITTLIGGVISLLFSVFSIQLFGLYAISVSVVLGFLIVYLIRIFLLKDTFNLRLEYRAMLLLLLLNVGVYIFARVYEENTLYLFVCLSTLTVVIFIFERNKILNFMKSYKMER